MTPEEMADLEHRTRLEQLYQIERKLKNIQLQLNKLKPLRTEFKQLQKERLSLSNLRPVSQAHF